jgi:long-chain acyl-CoA synthetase
MHDYLPARIKALGDTLAIGVADAEYAYGDLQRQYVHCQEVLKSAGIRAGEVVSVEGEYGIETIATFLALVANRNIIVPLSRDSRTHYETFLELGQVERRIDLTTGEPRITSTERIATHAYFSELREREAPGLILFTSGSTGANKAAVHDVFRLLEKFEAPRQTLRALVFLQLDHIGGVNTLLYTLANGGAVIVPADRSPESVCRAIARYQVELLPTSPTFLNLLLLSDAWQLHSLASLKLITYGTEPMPQSTLDRVRSAFPTTKLQQTYGMTELGILRSKSRDSGSLWVRLGGEGFDVKIVDGRLWVRAASAMLGYLNAPSPFDDEGYLDTGDQVEVDGDWVRILGRKSELINVGGSKVYPAEVESVLLEMPGVADATVSGERHPLTGHIVSATVRLAHPEPLDNFKMRMRQFCGARLPSYAVPARVRFSDVALHSERFKRMR